MKVRSDAPEGEVAVITATSANGKETATITIVVNNGLRLSDTSITVKVEKSAEITANMSDIVFSNGSKSYSTNRFDAEISGDTITVTGKQTCEKIPLTVQLSDGSDSQIVYVTVVAGLTVTADKTQIVEGESVTLTVDRDVILSGYEQYFTLSEVGYTLTAKNVDADTNVTITVTDAEDSTDSKTVTIKIVPLAITNTSRDVGIGRTLQLEVNSRNEMTWTKVSGDAGITLDPAGIGLVAAAETLKGGEKATFRATDKNNPEIWVNVEVTAKKMSDVLSLDKTEVTIPEDATVTIEATKTITSVNWYNSDNWGISWEIDNDKLKITATTGNQITRTLAVSDGVTTVYLTVYVVPKLTISQSDQKVTLRIGGDTKTITALTGIITDFIPDNSGLVKATISDDQKSVTLEGLVAGTTNAVLTDGKNTVDITIVVKTPRTSSTEVLSKSLHNNGNEYKFEVSDLDPEEIVAIKVSLPKAGNGNFYIDSAWGGQPAEATFIISIQGNYNLKEYI